MTDQISNWITSKEAIELSGYSEAGLRKLRVQKKIQSHQMGRYFLYFRPEIEALAEKRRAREERKQKRK